MSHYTVQYLDDSRHHQSICEYAEDAFSARNQAVNDVPYLHSHPNSITVYKVKGHYFVQHCENIHTDVVDNAYIRSGSFHATNGI